MTNREFYVAIAAGEMNDELKEFATTAIEKLDARNAARSSKPSKTAIANEPIKQAIIEFLQGKEPTTAPDIAAGMGEGITHNKVSALARQLVNAGILTVEEVKVPKKGKMKAYSVVAAD